MKTPWKSSKPPEQLGSHLTQGVGGNSFSIAAMTFCAMKMKVAHSRFIVENENDNVTLKMKSFRNENQMSPAGQGPQNESPGMKMDSLRELK